MAYLKTHPDVTDVLITGGDPLIMNTRSLAEFIEPLLAPELAHIQNIRHRHQVGGLLAAALRHATATPTT